jgi:DNA-binding NarL/FixJ family response regulator
VYGVEAIRVVIADDSALVLAGVEAMLADGIRAADSADASSPPIEVCGRASSLGELYAQVAASSPDVVVTDIRMPPNHDDEGIAAALHLRDTAPDLGVVVLSQFADPVYLRRLMSAGSHRRGYLLKDRLATPGELMDAISLVHRGGSFVDPTVVGALVAHQRSEASSPLSRLTVRETEILAAIATGKSNVAIGQQLFVSQRSVEKHINSIFAKLDLYEHPDANRRVRAVLLFLRTGLPE